MTKLGIAQPVRRVEEPRLLKGAGVYTDDMNLPGQLAGIVPRSPHAAARIRSIDAAAARALPGVHAVYTSADLAAALDAGAGKVWPDLGSNQVFDWEIGEKDKTEALFVQAAHVTRLTVVNNRIVINPMETRAAPASCEAGRFTLRINTQGGWVLKDALGDGVFKTGKESFRIVAPDVGAASTGRAACIPRGRRFSPRRRR